MAKFLFSAFADEASPDILEQIAACKENEIEYIELVPYGSTTLRLTTVPTTQN